MSTSGNPQLSTPQTLAVSVSPPAAQLVDPTSIRTSTTAFIAGGLSSAINKDLESGATADVIGGLTANPTFADSVELIYGLTYEYPRMDGQDPAIYIHELFSIKNNVALVGTIGGLGAIIYGLSGVLPTISEAPMNTSTGLVLNPVQSPKFNVLMPQTGIPIFSKRASQRILAVNFAKILRRDSIHKSNMWGLFSPPARPLIVRIAKAVDWWYIDVQLSGFGDTVDITISGASIVLGALDQQITVSGVPIDIDTYDLVTLGIPANDGKYIGRFRFSGESITVSLSSSTPVSANDVFIGGDGTNPPSTSFQVSGDVGAAVTSLAKIIAKNVPAHIVTTIFDIDGTPITL